MVLYSYLIFFLQIIQHAVLDHSFQLHPSNYYPRSNSLSFCKLDYTFLCIIPIASEGFKIFRRNQCITRPFISSFLIIFRCSVWLSDMTKRNMRQFMEQAEPELICILISCSKSYDNLVSIHKRCPLKESSLQMRKKHQCYAAIRPFILIGAVWISRAFIFASCAHAISARSLFSVIASLLHAILVI